MQKILKFCILALLISTLHSCQLGKNTRIAILHTNDMHGHLHNFDKLLYLRDSLLHIYDTVFLVSAGDMFSGNPYVDYYEDKGYPIVDIMNELEYSAAALGNHEFDYGQETLERRLNQASFPIMASNIVSDDLHFMALTRPHFLNFRDIEIQLFSLIETESNGHPSTHPKNLNGLTFIDPLEKAKELSLEWNEDKTVIGLTHVGYETDSLLAVNHPEIEVIIGGHSHTLIESERYINGVLMTQSGHYMEHVGMVELSFRDLKLTKKNFQLIDFETIPTQSNPITALIKSYETNEFLDEELAIAEATLKNRDELGCFYTDAQKHELGVDIAFQNYWGIRIDSLAEGPITRKEILKMDPFNNEVFIYNMTTDEIKSVIRAGYEHNNKKDIFIAGASYVLNTDANGSLNDIRLLGTNNKPLNDKKTYKVAINSYVASSYNFTSVDKGTNTNTITSDNIINYLLKTKTINYSGCNRILITEQ